MSVKNWVDIHQLLAKHLVEFYYNNKTNPSAALYKKLTNTKSFASIKWAEKFIESGSYSGIDPIHVFASFNYYNISEDTKREILSVYFQALGISTNINGISLDVFSEYPHPRITNIVANRCEESQNNIWEFFIDMMLDRDLSPYQCNSWYGIGIASLSMFMFWVFPDKFIPFDTNTIQTLKNNNILSNNICSIDAYIAFTNSQTLPKGLIQILAKYSINQNMELKDDERAMLYSYLKLSFEDEIKKSIDLDSNLRDEKLKKYAKKPKKVNVLTSSYQRNPHVVEEVLIRAKGKCEECKQDAPFERKSNKTPYLEVHHKIMLSEDGEDTVKNAIALCPNCHRKAHFG
jgi:hypothetical protein